MPTLDWIGKNAVANHHNEVPYRLIHCDGDLSAGDMASGNLLVQGDNLEALKALLPYYRGQVKCIYIDPPYNTGNESWVYNDNVNSPEIRAWLGKVVGKEAEDLSRHDKWLCMMYPRLKLLKKFLRRDGVIFVSIDDTEYHSLRIIMDETFGSSSRLGTIVWKKKTNGNNVGQIPPVHDFIFAYGTDGDRTELRGEPLSKEYIAQNYSNPDNHPLGLWTTMDLSANHEGPYFPITNPNTGKIYTPANGRYWVFNQEEVQRRIKEERIIFGKTGKAGPIQRVFLSEKLANTTELRKKTDSLWDNVALNSNGTKEISEILSAKAFTHPKPTKLVSKLIDLIASPNDLILDSFAGSGTTGHAVLDLNQQDGGNRKFILVEMDKVISEGTTARRLTKVINGYDKGGDPTKPVAGLGGGFRFCKLGDPLFDEMGYINTSVSFSDLAAHVFFVETGTPIPARADGTSPLIGSFNDVAIYLLFAPESLGQQSIDIGNVLTPEILDEMIASRNDSDPSFVVYAEGCTVSEDRLQAANVSFKQIPYKVAGV